MAVPKRRHSKSRASKRRSQWKIESVATSVCPQCREPKRPHRVCGHCGYYKGREVNKVEAVK